MYAPNNRLPQEKNVCFPYFVTEQPEVALEYWSPPGLMFAPSLLQTWETATCAVTSPIVRRGAALSAAQIRAFTASARTSRRPMRSRRQPSQKPSEAGSHPADSELFRSEGSFLLCCIIPIKRLIRY